MVSKNGFIKVVSIDILEWQKIKGSLKFSVSKNDTCRI